MLIDAGIFFNAALSCFQNNSAVAAVYGLIFPHKV